MSEINSDVTSRMVLNLDVGDLDDALGLVKIVGDFFDYVKVGSELYANSGASAVEAMNDLGKKVFLDLKLHDIPNTVERAFEAHAKRVIAMTTAHVAGGKEMLIAARRGLDAGANSAGVNPPILLGVSVLTSLPYDEQIFTERLNLINEVGCDMVCSTQEVQRVHNNFPNIRMLVPGIRLAGQDKGDQNRVGTPYEAIKNGATWIALGRAVYATENPYESAKEVANEVQRALDEM